MLYTPPYSYYYSHFKARKLSHVWLSAFAQAHTEQKWGDFESSGLSLAPSTAPSGFTVASVTELPQERTPSQYPWADRSGVFLMRTRRILGEQEEPRERVEAGLWRNCLLPREAPLLSLAEGPHSAFPLLPPAPPSASEIYCVFRKNSLIMTAYFKPLL